MKECFPGFAGYQSWKHKKELENKKNIQDYSFEFY